MKMDDLGWKTPLFLDTPENQGPVEDNGHLQQQKGKAGRVFATVQNVETLIVLGWWKEIPFPTTEGMYKTL